MVDQGGGDPGAGGDAGDANVVDTFGGDQLAGRLEDPVARAGLGRWVCLGGGLGCRGSVAGHFTIPRSLRMRSANQPTAASRADNGPGS